MATCNNDFMGEREFWLLVRRALLMFVKAIEVRYNIREKLTEL